MVSLAPGFTGRSSRTGIGIQNWFSQHHLRRTSQSSKQPTFPWHGLWPLPEAIRENSGLCQTGWDTGWLGPLPAPAGTVGTGRLSGGDRVGRICYSRTCGQGDENVPLEAPGNSSPVPAWFLCLLKRSYESRGLSECPVCLEVTKQSTG